MASYKSKTPFFKIPHISSKERLSAAEEKKAANIIENQLLAARKGIMCAVFEDGHYSAVDNMNGTWTVMLSSTGQNVALEGVLNGGFCHTKNPILWNRLEKGYIYHLYVRFEDKLYEDESSFIPIAKTAKMSNNVSTYLYLASVDCTGTSPVINKKPVGKIYSGSLSQHANDTENPHGLHLKQKHLTVTENIVVKKTNGESEEDVLLFDKNGNGELNKIIKRKTAVFKKTSAGDGKGMMINIPNIETILGVIVNEEVWQGQGPTFLLGNIAIETLSNGVRVYNSGEHGVPMLVTVTYLER